MKYNSKKWRKKFGNAPIFSDDKNGLRIVEALGFTQSAHIQKITITIEPMQQVKYIAEGYVDTRLLGDKK